MANQKKIFIVKEYNGRVWESKIDINTIRCIYTTGAGTEMDSDVIYIECENGEEIECDKVIVK